MLKKFKLVKFSFILSVPDHSLLGIKLWSCFLCDVLILASGLIALDKLALVFFKTKLKSFLTDERVDPGNAFLNTIPVKGKEPNNQKNSVQELCCFVGV